MNQQYKKEELKNFVFPDKIESFHSDGDGVVLIEYDGWHFDGTPKEAINSLLKYIFAGGEE